MNHHDEPRGMLGMIGTGFLFCIATVAVITLVKPNSGLATAPFAKALAALSEDAPRAAATAAADAFGKSGNVKVRFSLPGQPVEFPLALTAVTDSLSYQWVGVTDTISAGPAAALTSQPVIAPARPGFYRLAILHDDAKTVLPEPTLAVMVPFDAKIGGTVNGYRIGTYIAEKFGHADHDRPVGFVEVKRELLTLPVTTHLTLADFVTHDDQGDVWPKYVVLDPRLLDKLELVFADLGGGVRPDMAMDVHSGFRSPSHNARVPRAASDSRHQYGDAADVAIDADGDGQITMTDELLVMLAVERVEDAHPELVGGLGLYMSRAYRNMYVHIDARGKRSRWKG